MHIRVIHPEIRGEYGWPKVWKELVARGIRVGKERMRRTMQEHGIKARGKRKFVATTDSRHDLPIALNLRQRNFTAAAPNQVWTGALRMAWFRRSPEAGLMFHSDRLNTPNTAGTSFSRYSRATR